jgi:hypothetical protein
MIMKGFSKRNLEQIRKWYLILVRRQCNCATACFAIPDNLKTSLPSIAMIEAELTKELGENDE